MREDRKGWNLVLAEELLDLERRCVDKSHRPFLLRQYFVAAEIRWRVKKKVVQRVQSRRFAGEADLGLTRMFSQRMLSALFKHSLEGRAQLAQLVCVCGRKKKDDVC